HPTAPSPPAEPLWGAPLRLQTQERDTVLTRFIDNDHGHLARGRTGGTPPHVTSPSLPGVLLPAPPLALDQGVAFDLAPIGHGKARGLFALHAPSALMRIASMLHALRVAQPTIGHHHGGRQRQATPTTRCHALVAHQPGPVQLVPARCPRPHRSRPSHGQVPRHEHAPLANDSQTPPPVHARPHPLVRAAPPPTDQPHRRPLCVAHRVLPDPGPLPAALGGRPFVVPLAPEPLHHLESQAPQPLEPGAFGTRPASA